MWKAEKRKVKERKKESKQANKKERKKDRKKKIVQEKYPKEGKEKKENK